MSGPKPSHAFIASQGQKQKRDLDEFAASLQTTINKGLPSVSNSYQQVAVLSMTWSNDDMSVDVTENELLNVFQNCYNFAIERFVIPAHLGSLDAAIDLQGRINGFIRKWDSENSLTIYVYSGHGALVEGGRSLKYLIAGRSDGNGLVGPRFDWFKSSGNIEMLRGDALYIFDSCYAGQLAVGDGPELLAAANWGSVAGDILNTSFTRILATQLKDLNGDPCSVSHLFGKLHRGALDNNIAQVPVHVPHPTKDSIILQKLEKPGETRQSKRMKSLQIEPLKSSESRVLITVHLQDIPGKPDLLTWKNWLAKIIPPSIHPSQITVEGQFDTNSHLLLVALPLAVWTVLPADDTSYGFVSFVQSGNRLLEPGPLAYRSQPTGRENQPLGPQGRRERPQSFDSFNKRGLPGGSGGGFGGGGFGGGFGGGSGGGSGRFDGGDDTEPSLDE